MAAFCHFIAEERAAAAAAEAWFVSDTGHDAESDVEPEDSDALHMLVRDAEHAAGRRREGAEESARADLHEDLREDLREDLHKDLRADAPLPAVPRGRLGATKRQRAEGIRQGAPKRQRTSVDFDEHLDFGPIPAAELPAAERPGAERPRPAAEPDLNSGTSGIAESELDLADTRELVDMDDRRLAHVGMVVGPSHGATTEERDFDLDDLTDLADLTTADLTVVLDDSDFVAAGLGVGLDDLGDLDDLDDFGDRTTPPVTGTGVGRDRPTVEPRQTIGIQH